MNDKERFDQLESLLVNLMQRVDRLDQQVSRIDQRLDGMSEQMGDVITILKLSAERQSQSDERQERMLRQLEAQGRRTDATQAEILRLMQQWDAQATCNDTVAKRLDNHEPRIQRLEDDALRQAG